MDLGSDVEHPEAWDIGRNGGCYALCDKGRDRTADFMTTNDATKAAINQATKDATRNATHKEAQSEANRVLRNVGLHTTWGVTGQPTHKCIWDALHYSERL